MEFLRSKPPKFYYALLLVFLILNCFNLLRSDAQFIPQEEVETLQTIGTKLQSRYWKWPGINDTSCALRNGFDGTFANNNSGVTPIFNCNCDFNNGTVCHVTSILLQGLNLTGVLPAEFGNLTFLQELDLSKNYVNGTIPESLAQIPLITLSLWGNRMSGSIPAVIGDITTLEELYLDSNSLNGTLPENLGNLNRLRKMRLSANFFTGSIPETFSNLKNLTEFGIDGNSLSGKIPDLIGNWSKITLLDMQGTSMEGPIPSSISQLKNLIELRISDLNGPSSSFPNLQDMKKFTTLILRNCILTGPIPQYIGNFTEMNTLFLTNNSLNGTVSNWILTNENNFDISYNNFNNFSKSSEDSCQRSNVNLVSSLSSSGSNTTTWCLRKDLPCPESAKYHSLFINSGGGPMSFEGNEYEEDSTNTGPSHFFASGTKWAYSSTGTYMDKDDAAYTATNTFSLNVTGYYETARVAPSSLKYYGLCMQKGSYRVRLHFAEIMYSDDQTFSSIGRRIFDVSIQGNVVLKDFNIVEEAKGVGKGITKDFKDVTVNGSTLEIHLYWLGKGTTGIPNRGVYGPLISAITVTPNYSSISSGAVVGIVAAVAVIVLLILGVLLWWKGCLQRKEVENGLSSAGFGILMMEAYCCCSRKFSSTKSVIFWKNKENRTNQNVEVFLKNTGSFAPKRYSYSNVKRMTNSFKDEIGKGGFGCVYKGKLNDDRLVAVKILNNSKGKNGEDFLNELASISRTSHVNIVTLLGFCFDGSHKALIYEFMPNGSLEKFIYDEIPMKSNRQLGWETLYKIAIGIARGLEYLHRGCNTRILHFDIKPHNILLDDDFCPKITDFGLAKLCPKRESVVSMLGARGTAGYTAPEVYCRNIGEVSHKVDVYSFGMMVLEMVGGRKNINVGVGMDHTSQIYFPHWIYNRIESNSELGLRGVEIIMDMKKKMKRRGR